MVQKVLIGLGVVLLTVFWIVVIGTGLSIFRGGEFWPLQSQQAAVATPSPIDAVDIEKRIADAVEATVAAMPVSTPQIIEVTRIVEVTPTLDVQPTPTPFPTVAVVIPDGWQDYKLVGAPIRVSYPPDWSLSGEKTGSFSLIKGYQLIGLETTELPFNSTASEDALAERLKVSYLNSVSSSDTVRFFRQERLNAPFNPVFVTATNVDYVYDSTTAVLLTYATNGDKMTFVIYANVGSSVIPDGITDLLSTMIATVRFE